MNPDSSTLSGTLQRLSGDGHADGVRWRPAFFRLSVRDDRAALADLVEQHGTRLHVHDRLLMQVRDLVKVRHPGQKLSPADVEALVRAHLNGTEPSECGVWVYYPWSARLVHLLEADEFIELRTNRNRQKVTTEEQQALGGKRVGVVGLSVGQSVAVTLALERSAGELRLADFDVLDLSNLNRIRAGVHNVGVHKAYVTAREIAEIDPYLTVTVFEQGITSDNAEAFLLDGGRLDALVEECDSLDIKVVLRHHARRLGIPVVMDTSDRGMLDIERFDLEPDRPLFHGLAGDLNPADLTGLSTEDKLPYVLRIVGAGTMSTRLRASLLEVDQSISTWPQLGSEVAHGGAAAAHTVRRLLGGEDVPSGRFFLDLDDLRSRGTEHPAVAPAPVVVRSVAVRQTPVSDAAIRTLVTHAITAPSGGNSQPWKWLADGEELHLFLDADRSSGLIDFEHAGSYVALGCAAETLVIATHAANSEISVRPFPSEGRPDWAATCVVANSGLEARERRWHDDLHAQIGVRHTNRKPGDRMPLTTVDLESLTAAVRSVPSADIQWICEREHLESIGGLMGKADRLRMLHQQYHDEMYRELRWSPDEAARGRDGLDIPTLDLSPSDLAGLEMCRDWSSLALLRQWNGGRNLEKSARRSVASASAVALITMPLARSVDYFQGGRAIQRMWLTATKRGLAVHPMTTLPYLFARVLRGRGEGLDSATAEEIARLRSPYEALFRVEDGMAEVMLIRIGRAQASESRSSRRSVDEVLTQA